MNIHQNHPHCQTQQRPFTPLFIPTNNLTLPHSKNLRENHSLTHHHQYNPTNTSTRLQRWTLHHHSSTPNQQHHTHRLQQKIIFHRTILITLDMIKAFDTVSIYQLIHKIHSTHIPTTIVKFLVNYLKDHQEYTSYNNHTSKHTNIKAGVPQMGVLSPTLFNIYLSDILPQNQLSQPHHLRRRHHQNIILIQHQNSYPKPSPIS